MPAKSLLERTRDLLRNRPATLHLATIATDCECTRQWLYLFMSNANHDYGVRKVQRLHDYLEEHQKRVAAI